VLKAHEWRSAEVRAWRLTAFQRLDFAVDDVLDCLNERNVIGEGGSGIVYKGAMPGGGGMVAVKRLPAIGRAGAAHDDYGFSTDGRSTNAGRITASGTATLLADQDLAGLLYSDYGFSLSWRDCWAAMCRRMTGFRIIVRS